MAKRDKLSGLTAFLENQFAGEVKSRVTLDPETAGFVPLPEDLHPELRSTLAGQGISKLYSHQGEAFDAISSQQNTLIASRTASGKTLSFLLPILDRYMKDAAPFSTLLMYPTKALSRDQEGTLGRLMQTAVRSGKLGTFDGDTAREERNLLQQRADFIITNPDMLHSGILPNHNRKWRTFLSRLRYVVVDEVHSYRGIYGSHVANVFRRLLRLCDYYGSRPVFVCSSATIANPKEHAEALFGLPFTVVDRDGAPKPQRDLYYVNPKLVKGQGETYFRKGPGSVTVPLIRQASLLGVRTICFCKSRQQVERLHRAVVTGFPDLKDKVKPYRGGLLPTERRQLERDLFEGRITSIISTNALELGIDIGDLDLCILSGHPGTAASFWQQAGRVGRNGKRAVIVYVARNAPVDQFLVSHPDYITNASVEHSWLNADNPYIFLQHLPCVAHEYPLRPEEPRFDAQLLEEGSAVLKERGFLKPYQGDLRYSGEHYPARGVNLRGMTDYNIEIYCGTEVIGEIDPIGARGELYKDAIYQHLGDRFMSMDLDLDKKLCRVERVDVDYYTEAVWESRVELEEAFDDFDVWGSSLQLGDIYVNRQPKLYKKIRERTFENIGYGPITLAPFEYRTTGFSLKPSRQWQEAMTDVDRRYIGAALFGFAYLLRRAAPSLCMGDMRDIETDVSLDRRKGTSDGPAGWESSLFVYDSVEGGAGFSEKIFEKIAEAVGLCSSILGSCACSMGCPACVPPLPPGVEEDELHELLVESDVAVASTKSFVENLLRGAVVVPAIRTHKRAMDAPPKPPPVDEGLLRLRGRLKRAGRVLEQKREREH